MLLANNIVYWTQYSTTTIIPQSQSQQQCCGKRSARAPAPIDPWPLRRHPHPPHPKEELRNVFCPFCPSGWRPQAGGSLPHPHCYLPRHYWLGSCGTAPQDSLSPPRCWLSTWGKAEVLVTGIRSGDQYCYASRFIGRLGTFVSPRLLPLCLSPELAELLSWDAEIIFYENSITIEWWWSPL